MLLSFNTLYGQKLPEIPEQFNGTWLRLSIPEEENIECKKVDIGDNQSECYVIYSRYMKSNGIIEPDYLMIDKDDDTMEVRNYDADFINIDRIKVSREEFGQYFLFFNGVYPNGKPWSNVYGVEEINKNLICFNMYDYRAETLYTDKKAVVYIRDEKAMELNFPVYQKTDKNKKPFRVKDFWKNY